MLFSKPHTGSLILILDIQSSTIRGSIAYLKDKTLPEIVYSHTKNIPFRPTAGSSKIIHVTLEALKEIMGNVYHFLNMEHHPAGFPKKISETHFALSSPWVISQAKTLIKSFDQSTEVSEKLILELISKERPNLIPDNTLENSHVDIIEEKIFNVRLNGYQVHHWKGKKTKELEISFAISVSGTNTTDLFREACTVVPHNKVYFHSSLLLQHIAIQQLMPAHAAYTLVHVHGELTDVAVINHHSCIFFGSYPIGSFSVTRKIAKSGKSDIEVADSAIEIYVHKNFDTAHPTKDTEAVEDGAAYWTKGLKDMLNSVTPPVNIASRTILCAHAHEDFFAQSLKHAYPHLQTEILSAEELKNFIKFAPNLNYSCLAGIYTMAIHSLTSQLVI